MRDNKSGIKGFNVPFSDLLTSLIFEEVKFNFKR